MVPQFEAVIRTPMSQSVLRHNTEQSTKPRDKEEVMQGTAVDQIGAIHVGSTRKKTVTSSRKKIGGIRL